MRVPFLLNDLLDTMEKTNSKAVPPILWIIIVPCIVPMIAIAAINSIIAYLIGFWRCWECRKVFHRSIEPFEILGVGGGWEGGDPCKFCRRCAGK